MKIKVVFLICIILLIFTGCSTKSKEETAKNEYLKFKSNLLGTKNYTKVENLNCDITTTIDRINAEKVNYKVVVSNPKINMNKIKAVVVHNYYTEDIFPSIGFFNKTKKLTKDSDEKLTLKGTIKTDKNLNNLDLELKILIQYTTDDGKNRRNIL